MKQDIEAMRNKVWSDLKEHEEDVRLIYETAKEAWRTMDSESVMCLPKQVVTLALMTLAASLGELEHQHATALARVRDSN
mgnify:CR=1 FL=1